MDFLDASFHLLNFAAPAVVVALLLALAGRLLWRRRGVLATWALLAGVGLATRVFTLWWTGQDGSMVGYAALVLALAVAQWLWLGLWRR